MQYDVNNGLLQVVIEGEEINAVVGEAAQIDVGEAINYIQTGTAEIGQAVEEGITQFNGNATEKTNEFDLNAQNKTSDFNSNATQKTLDFNSNASDKTSEFNLNAQDKTSDFNANAVEKTNDFNSNAQDKTGDFNDNAVDKTNDFNDNASDKTGDFNLNAQNKTSDFNDNYTEKKGLIDAQVVIAEGAATTATNQAGLAKQWAIGDPSEPTGNSAKYWATQASNSATEAATSEDHSEVWAEGTDQEVQALGGVHSAKGWAAESATGQINSDWTENDPTSKAYILHKPTAGDNISLVNNQISAVSDASPTQNSTKLVQSGGVYSGLDGKQDEATAVNYDNISNCITEIPQDIKLEFNNGTVTLKAGSKVYVPNGFTGTTPKFDEVVIANDLTRTTNTSGIVFVNSTGTSVYTENLNFVYSGGSTPSARGIWYDTANNLVKYSSNGQTWSGQYSFPVGIVSTSGGQISIIDQVFNGFGYIGSIAFALPGVKGLIPNGRNADDTLKNIEFTIPSVKIFNFAYSNQPPQPLVLTMNILTANKVYAYNEKINHIYNSNAGTIYSDRFICGRISTNSSSKISLLEIKTAFHAVDYNDFNNIPHIVETYVNGTSWYRVYSDGWCEQGGHWNSSSNSLQTITLLKPYKDTNYNVQVTVAHTGAPYTSGVAPCYYSAAYKTVSSFQCYGYSDASLANKDWMACGYIS